MNTNLFEVIVVENPTLKEKEEGGLGKIVIPITSVLAQDKSAAIISVILNNDLSMTDKSRLEVIVRPFG